MPFKSDKQQRWMWANEPRIAREWTDRYGAKHGGIMKGLNRRHYLTGADGIMDIDTMYNEDMQFAPDVSGEYWSDVYDSAKTKAGNVYDFISDSIISPAWAPENDSMYVEELPSIYNIADRVIMLHNDKIIATGDPKELRDHCDSIFVKKFFRREV